MITFRDPPPLPVRVPSLQKSPEEPRTFGAPIRGWLLGLFVIACLAVAASRQTARRSENDAFFAAMTNSFPRQLENGVLAIVALGSPMRNLRQRLEEIHAECRGRDGSDSAITCLSPPKVWSNTYSRLRVRFSSLNRKLTAVEACPTLVHWSSNPVPTSLADRVVMSEAHGCWRDESNPADNQWTYATLPDHAFTVTVVHATDSVRRAASPTADTLIVRW